MLHGSRIVEVWTRLVTFQNTYSLRFNDLEHLTGMANCVAWDLRKHSTRLMYPRGTLHEQQGKPPVQGFMQFDQSKKECVAHTQHEH